MKMNESQIEATNAILSSELSKFATDHSLSNLEFLSTIPGSIGGNIFMNAGCYGSEIKDFLSSINSSPISCNAIFS